MPNLRIVVIYDRCALASKRVRIAVGSSMIEYIPVPCPPTRESLIDHYRKCIALSEHPATRAEFEEELRKVLAQ